MHPATPREKPISDEARPRYDIKGWELHPIMLTDEEYAKVLKGEIIETVTHHDSAA